MARERWYGRRSRRAGAVLFETPRRRPPHGTSNAGCAAMVRGFLSEWPRFWSAVRVAINCQSLSTRSDDAVLGVVRDELGLTIPIITGGFQPYGPVRCAPYGVTPKSTAMRTGF